MGFERGVIGLETSVLFRRVSHGFIVFVFFIVFYSFFSQESCEVSPGGVGLVLEEVDGSVFVVKPVEGYPGDEAGFLPGDELLTVSGVNVSGMDLVGVASLLRGSSGSIVDFVVLRDGVVFSFDVVRAPIPVTREVMGDSGGIGAVVKEVDGFSQVVFVYPGRAADVASVRRGDVVVSVDGVSTEDLSHDLVVKQLLGEYAGSDTLGTSIVVGVERGGEFLNFTVYRDIDNPRFFYGIGGVFEVVDGKCFLKSVLDSSPASVSGLQAGDEIVSIDGRSIEGIVSEFGGDIAFFEIQYLLRGGEGSMIELDVRRGGVGGVETLVLKRYHIGLDDGVAVGV